MGYQFALPCIDFVLRNTALDRPGRGLVHKDKTGDKPVPHFKWLKVVEKAGIGFGNQFEVEVDDAAVGHFSGCNVLVFNKDKSGQPGFATDGIKTDVECLVKKPGIIGFNDSKRNLDPESILKKSLFSRPT